MLSQKRKKDKKTKKNAPKSSLDCPFTQSLPSLDKQFRSEVKSLLKTSFSLVLRNTSVERRGDQSSSNGAKRSGKNPKVRKMATNAHVTFGFNAVMRGLEQNKIRCIFVKAEAKPDIIARSFLPACCLKAVPLIPLNGLSDVIREIVGIKSTLVLGLKSQACENVSSPFHDLYNKCCGAFGNEPLAKPSEVKSNYKAIKDRLTPALIRKKQVGAFHLTKRSQLERVFRPPKSSVFIYDAQTTSASRLKICDAKDVVVPPTDFLSKKKKEMRLNRDGSDSLDTSSCAFFIDVGEELDRTLQKETPNKDTHIQIGNDDPTGTILKHESKKRSTNEFSYVPTKIRRIKGNPNRHR